MRSTKNRCFATSAADVPKSLEGGDPERIADLLRQNPDLCSRLAASVDSRTAARWALTFSKAAGAAGLEKVPGMSGLDSSDATPRPEASQMWRLMVRTSVPFVGFGFFDNVIMLTVGETLDCTLGVAFGFSTLAAAGMGQMVSDASGITLQGLIERFADRLGLPNPRLSLAQQQMNWVRTWMIASRIVGIVFGCFLGMFPLIIMPERQPRLVDQIAEKLSSQNRAEFQRMVTTEVFQRGDKLLTYAQLSAKVYMIQEGTVEVIGRDVDGLPFMVCTIGPGHSFGVPELNRPSHVDLVAKDEKVIVQLINKDDFVKVTKEQEGMEVFKEARSLEHQVYLRSQGQTLAGCIRAEKGTGKTRMFAAFSQEEKLEVLSYVETDEVMTFSGKIGEGKVTRFAHLSEDQKKHALDKFQKSRSIDATVQQ